MSSVARQLCSGGSGDTVVLSCLPKCHWSGHSWRTCRHVETMDFMCSLCLVKLFVRKNFCSVVLCLFCMATCDTMLCRICSFCPLAVILIGGYCCVGSLIGDEMVELEWPHLPSHIYPTNSFIGLSIDAWIQFVTCSLLAKMFLVSFNSCILCIEKKVSCPWGVS